MQGKVCLVTGATSGIGQVTARELARLGARVIIVGRSPEKTEATLRQIHEETGATSTESTVTDLSSQAGVRQLAEQVRARCDRLDVLVNNAGAMFLKPVESVDGIEMTLALNHLSYFLLTKLLLPLLEASARRESSTSPRMRTREYRSISTIFKVRKNMAGGGRISDPSSPTSCLPMSWLDELTARK